MNRFRRTKRNQEIVDLYKKGIDARIIGEQFGLSRRAIYYIITKRESSQDNERLARTTMRVEAIDDVLQERKRKGDHADY